MNMTTNNTKTHFKMYKSGKRWLYVSITTFGAILGMTVMSDTIHADQNIVIPKATQVPATDDKSPATPASQAPADPPTPASQAPTDPPTPASQTPTNPTVTASQAPADPPTPASQAPADPSKPVSQTPADPPTPASQAPADPPTPASQAPADPPTPASQAPTNPPTPASQAPIDPSTPASQAPIDPSTPTSQAPIDSSTPASQAPIDPSTPASQAPADPPTPVSQAPIDPSTPASQAPIDPSTPVSDQPIEGIFETSKWSFNQSSGILSFQGGTLGEIKIGINKTDVTLGHGLEEQLKLQIGSIKAIDFVDKVMANSNSTGLFSNLKNLTTIINGDNLNTSNVTDFSYLFYGANKITDLNAIKNWDTTNVSLLTGAFSNMSQLSDITAIKNWHTNKLTDMSLLFYEDTALADATAIENWDTTNVQGLAFTFANTGITKLNLSAWKVSNVQNMSAMFMATYQLTSLNLSNWDVSNVKYFGFMFASKDVFDAVPTPSKLTNLNLSGWNPINANQNVPDTELAFFTAPGFQAMFLGQDKLTSLDLSKFNMTNLTAKDQFGNNGYTLMLSGMTGLRSLTLGANTKLDGTELPEPVASGLHNGWFLLGTDKQYQQIDTSSAELMSNYDGTTPGTYVTNSQATLAVTPTTTITAGTISKFDPTSLITSLTNFYGQKLTDFTGVKITGDTVDPQKAGTYHLTYTYTDEAGNEFNQPATVTVVNPPAPIIPSQASLTVLPTATVTTGPDAKFDPTSLITGLTDFYGQKLTDFSAVNITGNVDPSKPGDYSLTFTYTDIDGNVFTKNATVSVVPTKASLTVTPTTTVIAGPRATFEPTSLITSLTDDQGNSLTDFSGVKVTITNMPNQQRLAKLQVQTLAADTINLTVPGTYTVTYAYTDAAGNVVTQTANVNVIASKAALTVTPTATLNTDATTFDPTSLITNLADADGMVLTDYSTVKITGTVDPTTAGAYPLTYSYTDIVGNIFTATTTVTVIKADDDQPPAGGTPAPTDSNNSTAPTQPGQSAPTGSNGSAAPTQPGQSAPTDSNGSAAPTQAPSTTTKQASHLTQVVNANNPAAPKHGLTNAPILKQADAMQKQLPQTDENSTSGLWLTIVGIFLAGAALLGFSRKHH